MTLKIAFITADWDKQDPPMPGGAGWVRMYEPAIALKDWGGHEVVMGFGVAVHSSGRLFPVDHNGIPKLFEADIVVLQRWMHVDAAEAIRKARRVGQIVVNDIDDYFDGLHPTNMAYKTTSASQNKIRNRKHYNAAMQASDVVTCSTPFLAKRYKERIGVNPHVIRNAINVERFYHQPVNDKSEDLRIGWVGALPWRSNDLEVLDPQLDQFLTETNSKFCHHGVQSNVDPSKGYALAGVSGPNCGDYDFMRPADRYPEIVNGFDVGLVPLNKIPFNLAKSAIKGMEYSAAGIPFIATRTPEYEWFGQGILADTKDDWLDALRMMSDPIFRKDAAEQAYAAVKEQDWKVRWKDWNDLYTSLAEKVT